MFRRGALLSIVFPGAGQIIEGKPVAGFLMAVGFAVGIGGAVFRWITLDAVEPLEDTVLLIALVLAVLAWLGAQLETIRRLFRRCGAPAREKRDAHYREGMIALLRNDLEEAEAGFKAALRLDPWDADSMLQLGTVYRSGGRPRRARRMLKKCRANDLEGKWEWEIAEELSEP